MDDPNKPADINSPAGAGGTMGDTTQTTDPMSQTPTAPGTSSNDTPPAVPTGDTPAPETPVETPPTGTPTDTTSTEEKPGGDMGSGGSSSQPAA